MGLGLENLALQATSMGLAVHMMAGFDAEKTRETYDIPESAAPTTALAVGYPGSPDDLSDDMREQENAPRQRKPLNTFVFSGNWANPSALLADR